MISLCLFQYNNIDDIKIQEIFRLIKEEKKKKKFDLVYTFYKYVLNQIFKYLDNTLKECIIIIKINKKVFNKRNLP